MRGLVVAAVALACLGGALRFAASLGRAPSAEAARARAYFYYPLDQATPRLHLALPAGTALAELRLRSLDPSGGTAHLSARVVDTTGTVFAERELDVTLPGERGPGRSARATDSELVAFGRVTRLLELPSTSAEALLEVERSADSPPLLLRGRRRGEAAATPDPAPWRRLAARRAEGAAPGLVRLLEEIEPQPTAALPAAADAFAAAGPLYTLAPAPAPPVRLELVERSGGVIRVDAHATAGAPGFAWTLRAGDRTVATGEARREEAGESQPLRLRSPAGETALGAPLVRFLPFPQDADLLELSALDGGGATALRLAAWDGPSHGAGLWRDIDAAAQPRWRRLPPDNLAELEAAGRAATLLRPVAEALPLAAAAMTAPVPLPLAGGASTLLLSPRLGAVALSDVVALSDRPIRICPATQGPPLVVRLRADDAAALGQSVTLVADGRVLSTHTLMAMAVDVEPTPLPGGCFSLGARGLGNVAALVDARLAPEEVPAAHARVRLLSLARPLTASIRAGPPARVTFTVYPEAGAQLLLRLLVDDSAPRRSTSAARRFTVPVLERRVDAGRPGAARLPARPGTRLDEPERLSLTLGDDLAPGEHRLSLVALGTGRAWVRASLRPLADDPGEEP